MKRILIQYALPAYVIYLISYGPLYLVLYRFHPYYARLISTQTLEVFRIYFFVFLIGGIPYFLINGWLAPKEIVKMKQFIASFRVFWNKRIIEPPLRLHLLKILLKGFYAPLMVNYAFIHFGYIQGLYQGSQLSPFDWIYQLVFHSIFLVDTAIFAFGYLFESHWLGNSIRSIEPTLFGWVIALSVYEPFYGVTNTLLPLSYQDPISLPYLVTYGIRLATLVAYGLYGWATIALLFKASNLTNRGIVSWGPYRYLRHPAYIGKNVAWWLEMIPYLHNIGNIAFLLGLNLIYYYRAITEERHLSLDPAYRTYKKKVKFWGVKIDK